ncbi:MAG: PIG-L deacetylase family protein [Bacteroidota bacterium]
MEELQFEESDRILILAPHPDDESIGCGGLLLQYAAQCDVVVLTDGRHGGKPGQSESEVIAIRQKVMASAMEFADVNNLMFLGVEDGKLAENFDKFSELGLTGYNIIVCPHMNDNHPDHACVYDFLQQLKFKAKVVMYELWSTIAQPSHYLDISKVVEEKKRLISFHRSQVEQVDYVSKITGLNCYRGMLVYPAIAYAEAYKT